jgi:predicted PurR-regulated permease PerM/methylmalonyl-CoA mutase cobalamin-binding subunit
MPLALAVLFAFLLTPLVIRLERLKLGRIPSVMLVLVVSLSLFAGVGWIVANQLIEIINQLPSYTSNIREKMESLHGPLGGSLAKATDSVQKLTKELSTSAPNQPPPPAAMRPVKTKTRKSAAALPADERPLQVEVVEPQPGALQALRKVLGPLLAPLSTAGVVVVFSIVMLIGREDLRNRLLRLLGQRQLNLATQAFDDATQRVSRYLRMQFVVNATYGSLVTIGLYFIGIPTALLWGVLAGILRFVPYVGPIVGGGLPLIMALAAFKSWLPPILCLGLFLVIELPVAYIVEPWLYGAHTGISSLAILVAAAFWTVLWGPVGLVLSTPLTVCLVVIGRYVPQFEFLYVILGDEPVFSPDVQLYQRLLAMDQREAHTVIELFLKDRSLVELYDAVIIPALSMAEEERHRGALDEARENFFIQSINEVIAELADHDTQKSAPGDQNGDGVLIESRNPAASPEIRVVCIPASDRADETTAGMLAQLLELAGYATVSFPVMTSPTDVLEDLTIQESDIVCISALPPFALMNARSLSKRLRATFPKLRIVVGLWNFSGGGVKADQRLEAAFAVEVVTTLAQAVERVRAPVESMSLPGIST